MYSTVRLCTVVHRPALYFGLLETPPSDDMRVQAKATDLLLARWTTLTSRQNFRSYLSGPDEGRQVQ